MLRSVLGRDPAHSAELVEKINSKLEGAPRAGGQQKQQQMMQGQQQQQSVEAQ